MNGQLLRNLRLAAQASRNGNNEHIAVSPGTLLDILEMVMWQTMDTAPKSAIGPTGVVKAEYLMGYCPDESSVDAQACICVVWWEPEIDGGCWYGENGKLRPTKWARQIPAPPEASMRRKAG